MTTINIQRDPESSKLARQVLDLFLFEDIINNTNHFEDTWDVSYMGDDFVLLHRESGTVYNFALEVVPGTLTVKEINQIAEDQEWFYDEDEEEDEDD